MRAVHVVGGGPAGVLAAFAAMREGAPVRIFEKSAFPRHKMRPLPRSIVFECGNFQTGVKVRWPDGSIDQIVADLRRCTHAAWRSWSPSLAVLTAHLNGQPAK